MDTFTMTVPDLQVADDFYRAFGLDVREEGNGAGALHLRLGPSLASIGEGGRKKLNHLSFGVFEEDFEPMRRRDRGRGRAPSGRAARRRSNGFWFTTPTAC
jgi:catechol 2,3-dioxygenase-like lactoylglutathione lyase family enzyme